MIVKYKLLCYHRSNLWKRQLGQLTKSCGPISTTHPHPLQKSQFQLMHDGSTYFPVVAVSPAERSYNLGRIAIKPVFGVSEKARFKPVSSATGTSLKIEISSIASLHMIHSTTRITKALGSDCADAQAGLRLCCSQTPEDRFFSFRGPFIKQQGIEMEKWYQVNTCKSLCQLQFSICTIYQIISCIL